MLSEVIKVDGSGLLLQKLCTLDTDLGVFVYLTTILYLLIHYLLKFVDAVTLVRFILLHADYLF